MPDPSAAADVTVIEPTLTVGKQVSLTQVGGYATSLTGGGAALPGHMDEQGP